MYPSIVCTINMHVYTFTASHISSMYNVPCTNVGNNSMLSNYYILLVKLRLNPPSNRFNPCDLVTAKSPFGAFSESKLWLNSCIWQHLQLFGFHFDIFWPFDTAVPRQHQLPVPQNRALPLLLGPWPKQSAAEQPKHSPAAADRRVHHVGIIMFEHILIYIYINLGKL